MDESALAWNVAGVAGAPAARIGSTAFNAQPATLSIPGVRASATELFRALEALPSLTQAAQVFDRYMQGAFGLPAPAGDAPGPGAAPRPRRWRASYRKLLEGWGFDSNSPQAAVLKGWVESRFGLVPNFHGGPLQRLPSPAWTAYVEQKLARRDHGDRIHEQLDLLYEYCQWAAPRFGPSGHERIAVWRGIDAAEAGRFRSGSLRERQAVLRMNSVVSFSLSREHAEGFGDWILETEVPRQKLLFFPGLLGRSLLAGEGEVIALGGDYEVRLAYW